MFKRIAIGAAVLLLAFLGFVATRPAKFHYERSGVIMASPDKIFPYISQFSKGELWSPFEEDKSMKKTITGEDGQVGSKLAFEGEQSGAGELELLSLVPNENVHMRLTMLKPFKAENLIEYKLTPESDGTRFTWAMSGDNGFLGKLISVFVDCEKMIGGQFEKGIQNLKTVVEAAQH